MSSVYDSPSSDVTRTPEMHDPPLLSASGRMGRLRYLAHSTWTTTIIMVAAALIGVFAGFGEAVRTSRISFFPAVVVGSAPGINRSYLVTR